MVAERTHPGCEEPFYCLVGSMQGDECTVPRPRERKGHQMSETTRMGGPRFCRNCGTAADPEAAFCRSCGTPLQSAQPRSPSPEVEPQTATQRPTETQPATVDRVSESIRRHTGALSSRVPEPARRYLVALSSRLTGGAGGVSRRDVSMGAALDAGLARRDRRDRRPGRGARSASHAEGSCATFPGWHPPRGSRFARGGGRWSGGPAGLSSHYLEAVSYRSYARQPRKPDASVGATFKLW